MTKNNISVRIIKFIDFCWLNNFIQNSISPKNNKILDKYYKWELTWEIFSNKYYNEKLNILYFIKSIKKHHGYSLELLLLTINIFEKICVQYAHQIENYTCLFAAIYIAANKIVLNEYLSWDFLSEFFKLDIVIARKMVEHIDFFMCNNDIYFGVKEQNNLMIKILYSFLDC